MKSCLHVGVAVVTCKNDKRDSQDKITILSCALYSHFTQ